MTKRKKISGGQALVMVTLALIAMCGMMGLAVDLGWSFFVQKQAQTAADGAALAAVQETYKRNGGGLGTLTCGSTADCQPITDCANIASTSNLYNGCLYAATNSFDPSKDSRQWVKMQADVKLPVPTAPGVTDVKYWVTVRTGQTIPQLFSSVLGNTQGTVSAIATAAIAGSIVPGSFYGMNREGDCLTGLGSSALTAFNCGVDVDISGSGSGNKCYNSDGSDSGYKAKLCAPAGAFLASQCNGSTLPSGASAGACGSNNGNYAGQTQGSSDVWAQNGTQIRGQGWVNDTTKWLPSPPGVSNQSSANFGDPTSGLKQPPIVSPSQPTCAIPNDGLISTNTTLGPYQYYATKVVNGATVATGNPIRIDKNTTVTFDPSSASCPGTPSATAGTGTFKTFTFWGGLSINGNSNTNVNFGAGQYVMAGTTSQTGPVFYADGNGTVTGDQNNGGTMFLLTSESYSTTIAGTTTSLSKPAALSGLTFYNGYTDLKNVTGNLYGVSSSSPLSDWKNFLFWQDRANSNDTLNLDTGDFQSFTHPSPYRTDTSPQFILEDGGINLNMKGVFYQPRGAWLYLKSGGASAAANANLMLITGALTCGSTGCGTASITLLTPTAPIVRYVTSLIQ